MVRKFGPVRFAPASGRGKGGRLVAPGGAVRSIVVVALLAMMCPVGVWAQTPVASGKVVTVCATTHHAYTVDVCLTAPGPESAITSDPTISATATVSDPTITVLSITFSLNGRNVLTDFDPEYEFELPISNWVDGSYNLSATVSLSDKTKTDAVATRVIFRSGTESPPVTDTTFKPTPGRAAGAGEPFVLAAVGDGAGGSPESAAVTDEISSWNPNLFLYLGDVYNGGRVSEFANWYAPDTYFGRFRDITDPTIGNHEYGGSAGPEGYLQYWGNPPHYYSVDTAGWHLISLDSNPKFNESNPASEQMQWLLKDLEASKSSCTLVFYHHPRFNVGSHVDAPELQDLWNLLAQHHVTLVLTGHDHNYQRWDALDGNGTPSPQGVTSVVVGTGGQTEYPVTHDDPRLAAPARVDPGAMRLELNPHGAAMQFITTDGIVRDSTVVPCKGAGASSADTTPPSTPGTSTAIRSADGTVTVRWAQATDNTGVASYHVYRDNTLLGSVPPQSSFIDDHADPSKPSVYRVVARDGAGNSSVISGTGQTVGMVDANVLFSDAFATGSFARWTDGSSIDVAVKDATGANAGTSFGWVARTRGGLRPAYARVKIPGTFATREQIDLQVSVDFCSLEQGNNPAVFFRLRSADDKSLFSVYNTVDGTLGIFNDTTGTGLQGQQKISRGEWHRIIAHITGPPATPRLTVSLDGNTVPELSTTIDLKSSSMGIVQLGDSTGNRVFDIQYRDVTVSTNLNSANATPVATPKTTSTPQAGIFLPPTLIVASSREFWKAFFRVMPTIKIQTFVQPPWNLGHGARNNWSAVVTHLLPASGREMPLGRPAHGLFSSISCNSSFALPP